MKLISILVSLLLAGCITNPTPIITKEVRIPANMLEYCPNLNEEVVITTFDEVLKAYADVAISYGICADKQYNNVQLLKKFGSVNETTPKTP